jgi:hypothetical protein
VAVFLLAIAARLAFLFLVDQPLLFQHQYTYFSNALDIATRPHPLAYVLQSDAWRTWDQHWTIAPLYFLFAAGVFSLFGPHLLPLQLLQCVLDAGVAVGVAALARRVAGPRGAWAGVAYALHWPAVELPTWTMTENLHTTLFVGGTLLLSSERAARGERKALLTGGFLVGLSALARSVSSAFLGVLALGRVVRDGLRRGALVGAIIMVGGAAAIAPWLVRNAAIGEPPMIETAAYENIWWANRFGDAERYRRQQDVVFSQPTPEAQRAAALRFALKNIRERPGLFLGKVRDNFWHFLRPDWTDSFLRVERPGPFWQYAVGFVSEDLLLLAMLPLLVVFLAAGKASPTRDVILLWTTYYVTMVVVVFHNEIRYRSALVPFAFAGAAGGIAVLADRVARRRLTTLVALAVGLFLSARVLGPYLFAAGRTFAASRSTRPALAALERGDATAAAQGIEAAAARDPRSSRPWLAYARGLVRTGRIPEAIDAYRRAASTGRPGGTWIPTLVLPRLLREAGRAGEADAATREADAFSWSLDPWQALEIAWAELPPPRADEIRLGQGEADYGAVRGFLHPRGGDPKLVRRYLLWNRYGDGGPQPPPGTHRWSRHRAWLRLVPLQPAAGYELTLEMGAPFPSTLVAPEVDIRVGHGPPTRFTLGPEIRPYIVRTPLEPGSALLVRLDSPTWCRPGEPAEQGIRVDRVRVRPLP